MNKSVTFLWALIIAGAGFLLYNYASPTLEPEDISTPISTTPSTPLQEEVAEELSENKTYSSLIKEGDQLHNNGYHSDAIKTYQKALTTNPTSIDALYRIGLTYLEDNKPTEARRYFEQIKESTENVQIDILIGRTYINERKIPEALSYFKKLDPTNAEVRYYIAILKILHKNHEEALAELKTLASAEGTFNEKIKEKVQIFVNAYHEFTLFEEGKTQHMQAVLAKAFIDAEEFEASIPLLYDIIKMQNNYRDAWVMLGYSYLQTGKVEDAVDALLQAKTLDPQKPQTLFFIGITYAVQEQFDEAIQYLEKSLEVGFEPKSLANQKLADLYLIKKEYEKALQSYKEIIDLNIADLNIFTKAIWVCIEKIQKPQRAIGFAEEALKQFPDQAAAYNLRGWAFVAYEDYEKAQEDLIKALELDPNLDSAYLNLGWLYEKQEIDHLAKEYYKKAYTIGNGNSIANLAAIRFNNILKADISSPYSP
jgi:tetratricopeptide (TPR) repeat protein